jgi:hypothetical protein
MIILRMIEILQKFFVIGSQWEKRVRFETDPSIKKWRQALDFSFRRKVGFHNIKQAHWKSPSGFHSFFPPCLR